MIRVAVIGAGLVGSLTARALSRYRFELFLLEKHSDVSMETSKANSAIVHAGFDAPVGSNKAKFNVLGNAAMDKLCEDLDVHFKRNGSLVLAFTEEDLELIQVLYERGLKNKVPKLSILSAEQVKAMEPALSDEVKGALLAETGGIVCPYTLAQQAARSACENGVILQTNSKVEKIDQTDSGFLIHIENKEPLAVDYIVNAAGVFADDIARMAGDESVHIKPRKGEYMLCDKKIGNMISHTLFQVPNKLGKGILITPTVDGNLLIGPNANEMDDKECTETSEEGLAFVLKGAKKAIPTLSSRNIITSFAGLRAIAQGEDDDFIIARSKTVPQLINLAGIQSPGLSAAPAIAEEAVEILTALLAEKNISREINPNFIEKTRAPKDILRLSVEELNELIKQNPAYGKIVCRCETVSEGQIIEAIQDCSCKGIKPSIDSVKRRTRAGMGRCQGGFCMPRVLEIISRETGIPFTEVMKGDDGSYILTRKTKG